MESAYAATENLRRRNSWIDVVRGIAILGVVSVHSSQLTDAILRANRIEPNSALSSLLSLGKYGVELFFFISGWLLFSIYGKEKRSTGKSYWVRRMARILPLWILFLSFQILRSHIGNGGGGWKTVLSASPHDWASSNGPFIIVCLTLTFLLWLSPVLWNTVIPGGWSIQSEVGHYLLFPLIRKRGFPEILSLLIVANFFTVLGNLLIQRVDLGIVPDAITQIWNSWGRLNLFSTFSYFFFGMVAFEFKQNYELSNSLAKSWAAMGITPFRLTLFIFCLIAAPLNFGSNLEAIMTVCVMIGLSYSINKFHVLRALFSTIGKYSYFIYFCHFQVFSIFSFIALRNRLPVTHVEVQIPVFLCVFLLNLFLSTFLATISWKFFEKPIIQLGQRVKP
jgi:peptidoglycan/LPS O-acetylase OafA/YrhL